MKIKVKTMGYFWGYAGGFITAAVGSGIAFVSFLKYWTKKNNS